MMREMASFQLRPPPDSADVRKRTPPETFRESTANAYEAAHTVLCGKTENEEDKT